MHYYGAEEDHWAICKTKTRKLTLKALRKCYCCYYGYQASNANLEWQHYLWVQGQPTIHGSSMMDSQGCAVKPRPQTNKHIIWDVRTDLWAWQPRFEVLTHFSLSWDRLPNRVICVPHSLCPRPSMAVAAPFLLYTCFLQFCFKQQHLNVTILLCSQVFLKTYYVKIAFFFFSDIFGLSLQSGHPLPWCSTPLRTEDLYICSVSPVPRGRRCVCLLCI